MKPNALSGEELVSPTLATRSSLASGSANPQPGGSAGSASSAQSWAGQSLSPSSDELVATVGETNSSLDNASGFAGEQGPRPRSTRQVPWLPPQLGPQHNQSRLSRGSSPTGRKTT